MFERSRATSLVLPFAVVGGAAGFLSWDFLASPFVRFVGGNAAPITALFAAGAAAAVGALLTRWCATRMEWNSARATWVRLAFGLAIAGAFVGVAVTIVTNMAIGIAGFDVTAYTGTGAVIGAASSLPFVPVCAAVLSAAKRAERARLGSLVAGSDRRAVWTILMIALSVPTAANAIDWPVLRLESSIVHVRPPWIALAVIAAAFIVCLATLRADRAALAHVRRIAASDELSERDASDAASGLPRLDLGLGDDVRASVTRGSAAYRSRDRATSLVLGCPDEAVWALDRAVRRDVAGLAIVALVFGVHVFTALAVGCIVPRSHRTPLGTCPHYEHPVHR